MAPIRARHQVIRLWSVRGKKTPVTAQGLKKYDHLPAAEAILAAWTTPGSHPDWNEACKDEVRNLMPLLARAMDRAVLEGL